MKTPDPFNEDRKKVFEDLVTFRGYKSPNPGGEAKAITWMLKQGYTVKQIMSCHAVLKKTNFWEDKFLAMMHVKTQIGEHLKSGGGESIADAWEKAELE